MQTRRGVLLSVAGSVATLSGCGGSGPNTPTGAPTPTESPTAADATDTATTTATPSPHALQPAEEPFPELATSTAGEGFTQTGTASLPRHRYGVLPLDPPGAFHIDGSVTSRGPPVDFLVLREAAFPEYRSRASVEYVESVSLPATTGGEFEDDLPEEEYRILFDNTEFVAAPAAEEVVVDFRWRITPAEG